MGQSLSDKNIILTMESLEDGGIELGPYFREVTTCPSSGNEENPCRCGVCMKR